MALRPRRAWYQLDHNSGCRQHCSDRQVHVPTHNHPMDPETLPAKNSKQKKISYEESPRFRSTEDTLAHLAPLSSIGGTSVRFCTLISVFPFARFLPTSDAPVKFQTIPCRLAYFSPILDGNGRSQTLPSDFEQF